MDLTTDQAGSGHLEAVYSPLGPDGCFPMPVWDPLAALSSLGGRVLEAEFRPELLHSKQHWLRWLHCCGGHSPSPDGMMDTYFLNEAHYLLWEFVKEADPPADIKFDFGFRKPHWLERLQPEQPGPERLSHDRVRADRRRVGGGAPAINYTKPFLAYPRCSHPQTAQQAGGVMPLPACFS